MAGAKSFKKVYLARLSLSEALSSSPKYNNDFSKGDGTLLHGRELELRLLEGVPKNYAKMNKWQIEGQCLIGA